MPATIVPEPIPASQMISKPGYGSHTQRQRTRGWVARGRYFADGSWLPEPGLPAEVIVYADMPHPAYRDALMDNGGRIMSRFPSKKATAGDAARDGFEILPPSLEEVQEVMALLLSVRPKAIADIEEELDDIKFRLETRNALMGGEAMQYRKKQRVLKERILQLKDDRNFDAQAYYRKYVEERQEILASQMSPEQRRHAALVEEHHQWTERLDSLDPGSAKPTTSKSSVPEKVTSSS